jgi:peptidoglycan/xylan/chitin deacetylase (PgdA/CDA1 family)
VASVEATLIGLRRIPAPTGVVSAGAWLPVLRGLPGPAGQEVGMSFDDGPCPTTTPALIDLLHRHNASASFFLSGERAAAAPHLVSDLISAGHDVFAHGWRHIPYAGNPAATLRDMERAEALLRRFRPTPKSYLVRLPYMSGRRRAELHRAIRAWSPGAQLAFWRFGFEDHLLAPGCTTEAELQARCSAAAERVLRQRRLPGAILLLHEAPYDTKAPLNGAVAALLAERVLDGLACRGLRGVKLRPMSRQSWITRFVLA